MLYLQSALARYIPGRSEGDSMEPLFVPLCPGMQVSPGDGEGSGKHLYLKSTLSTVAQSERSSRPLGGLEGRRTALSAHADTEGGSPALTPLQAVSLELFMVIVLSAFLSLPREARAQGG